MSEIAENDELMKLVMTSYFGEVCSMMTEIAMQREDKCKELFFEFTDVKFTLKCEIKENKNAE